jgi:hypothetical protein
MLLKAARIRFEFFKLDSTSHEQSPIAVVVIAREARLETGATTAWWCSNDFTAHG